MALSVTNTSSTTSATLYGVTSGSWSHTVSSGSNRMLIVAIQEYSASGGVTHVTSITFGSQSLTHIGDSARATYLVSLWYLIAPNVTTANITVTFSSINYGAGGAITFSGAAQNAPTNTATSNNSGTSVTTTITPNKLTSYLVDGVKTNGAVGTSMSVGSGQTQVENVITSNYNENGMSYKPVSTSPETMSWTLTLPQGWAQIVVEIEEYAAAVKPVLTNIPVLASVAGIV